MDFRSELNEEQYAAVTAPDGPSLVIAAAGTGKTRTLVYRVAWLIEQGVDPNRILLLTFTNKAAREMLDRAQTLTGGGVSGLLGGTFHHLANRLLRRHAKEIGFGFDYTILDQDDAKKLVKSCTDELDLTDKHFPKPQVLLSLFGLASGSQKPLDELAYDWFDDLPINIDDILKLRDHYVKRKKDLNVMDFDDLLLHALKLFQTSERVRAQYQEQFQYVLVDEYQDTNTIQAEWIHLLAGKHRNLMVVGDDFQSIYSWRGADYQNFLSFPDRYPDAQVYKLETNYRSTPEILEVANACIKGNPRQFQKTLHAVREGITEPTLVHLRDGDEQARYVIAKIEELKREGTKLSEIAVLYRSHFHAMELQLALTHARFPYQVTSGIRFFEQAHVKDACTVLRLLENPQDELAFKRLVEMFPKLGPKTADKIWKKLGSRFEACKPEVHAELLASLPKTAVDIWRSIQPVFLAYDSEELSGDPGEIIYRFNKAFYSEYLVETFENARHRQEDLDSLIDFTARFESCADFLSEMALLTNLDAEAETAPASADSLRLSTVHQAKGLEWKAVFVLWMNEDCFPSRKSVEQIGGEAEERRLFYVAATRAEDRLFLCCPQIRRNRDGSIIPYEPSRFVQEIPPDLLQKDYEGVSESGFSSYQRPSPRPNPYPPKNHFETSQEIQIPLKEKTEIITLTVPLTDIHFSKGKAIVDLLINKTDLPGFTRYKDETLSLNDPIFQEPINHLTIYLDQKVGIPKISFKLSVKYDRRTVHQITLIENNLSDALRSYIDECQSKVMLKRLAELAEQNIPFIESDELFPQKLAALNVSDNDAIIETLITQHPCQKHERQIRHLASRHCFQYEKLIIGTDQSVLFLIEGTSGLFFVWEMLDRDNATYLWKTNIFPSEAEKNCLAVLEERKAVEIEIAAVKKMKRNPYRSSKKESSDFSWFKHPENDDGTIDFNAWKRSLDEIINA